jgi:sulfonate transport system substrate-binding protein
MTDIADNSKRRTLRALMALLAAPLALAALHYAPQAQAADARHINIGWQKGGSLAVIEARGALQKNLAAKGVSISWLEFPAGPQMLEALNVGSIDFGLVGETPPVFAQAAGTNLVYVGNDPAAPRAEAILVPKGSPLHSVAELKGKKIVLNKGSNVHYLLVKLLEKAGLRYGDVQVVYLPPADARAAFESGSVDAWVIWDPFAAAAESQIGARILADGTGAANNYIFFVASRPYADKNGDVIELLLHEINTEEHWIEHNLKAAAAIIAPQIGVSDAVAETAFSHYAYGVEPLTDDVVRQQQQIADVFYDLKLIPTKIDVASIVWQPSKHTPKS